MYSSYQQTVVIIVKSPLSVVIESLLLPDAQIQAHIKRTIKSNNARSNFIIASSQNEVHKLLLTKRGQQTCQQNVKKRNYEDQPYALKTLWPISELALC